MRLDLRKTKLMNNIVTNNYLLLVTVLLFGISVVTRFLPFWIQSLFKRSLLLQRVGNYLPSVIMLLLVFHTLEGVKWQTTPYGLPETCSLVIAILIYTWRRSLLLSLSLGTFLYVMLVNFVIT